MKQERKLPEMQTVISSVLYLASLLILASIFTGQHGIKELRSLESESGALRATEQQLKKELISLREKSSAIKTDDYALEKAAREELGLSADNEIIYVFPKE